MPNAARATRRALAVTACLLVTVPLTACDPPVSPPGKPAPSTPPSPYTATGTTLHFGQPAVVPWQDLTPQNAPQAPATMIRLSVTTASDGEIAGPGIPDPGSPPSFNDVTFFVHFSTTNTGKIPAHPGTFLLDVSVYDSKGEKMTPATSYGSTTNCTDSIGSDVPVAPGATVTDCKPYLGSVLDPHVAKVVYDGYAPPAAKITWTP